MWRSLPAYRAPRLGRALEHHAEHAAVDPAPAVVHVRRARELHHTVLRVDDRQHDPVEQRLHRRAAGGLHVPPLPDAAERIEHARRGRRLRRHPGEGHEPGGDAGLFARVGQLVEVRPAVAVFTSMSATR